MIDKIELKRLAQMAKSRGPWIYSGEAWIKGKHSVSEVDHRHDGVHLDGIYYQEDAEYLAAVDPDTVLDLLVEIERLGNIVRSYR